MSTRSTQIDLIILANLLERERETYRDRDQKSLEPKIGAINLFGGAQAMHAGDDELDEFMHLFMCNRGILMTPFHNMALMCPTTSQEQVDLHS